MNTPTLTDIELADKVYELALNPRHYNSFLRLWGEYVDRLLTESPDITAETFSQRPLIQHFRRASDIVDRLNASIPADISARAIVSRASGPAIVLSRTGQVLATNITIPSDILTRPDELATFLKISPNDLSTAIRSQGFEGDMPLFMLPVTDPNDPSPLVKGYIATRVKLDDTQEGVGILISSIMLQIDESLKDALCETFTLSPAEADVAILLAEGLKPNEVADRRGAALNTVRTQIKKIQKKMGLSGTTEIVRTLCGFAANSTNPILPAGAPLPDWSSGLNNIRRQRIRLADGRMIAIQEQGAPDGKPILYLHSLYHGPLVTEAFSSALAKAGWRLIAPSRPGYGTSDSYDPFADQVEFVEQTCADLSEVLDILGVESCVVISNSFASVFAQAFAVRYPQRTKALMFVSHAPIWEADLEGTLNPRFSMLAKTARVSPDVSTFIRKAALAFIRAGYSDKFLRGFVEGSRADELALRRPEVQNILSLGAQHSLSCAPKDFSDEGRIVLSDWSNQVVSLEMPFFILSGTENSAFEYAVVERYVSKVPEAQWIRIEGAGHNLVCTHWPSIMHILKQIG